MRYKIQISVPAILSTAVFICGLIAMLLYSLEVINGKLGTGFVISITLQTFGICLISSILCSLIIFRLLKRRAKDIK
ncbi:MAG TPA: hypothetical protein VFW11_20690 [Cyclobacteriaceae bacterium]|nr:hypothetical protein [Cyclobacteriaceae bacterium]